MKVAFMALAAALFFAGLFGWLGYPWDIPAAATGWLMAHLLRRRRT